jgi:hypothetical protein
MPEAAVNENDLPSFNEDDVRLSGKIGSVEPESVAACPCDFSDQEFRFRIFAADERHALATLSPRQRIHRLHESYRSLSKTHRLKTTVPVESDTDVGLNAHGQASSKELQVKRARVCICGLRARYARSESSSSPGSTRRPNSRGGTAVSKTATPQTLVHSLSVRWLVGRLVLEL